MKNITLALFAVLGLVLSTPTASAGFNFFSRLPQNFCSGVRNDGISYENFVWNTYKTNTAHRCTWSSRLAATQLLVCGSTTMLDHSEECSTY